MSDGPNIVQQALAMLYRQRWPLALCLLAALALGIVAVLVIPKSYTASATVQLEQQASQVLEVPGLNPEPEDTSRFFQTQLDRLSSRSLTVEVANALQVQRSPEILAALSGEYASQEDLLQELSERVHAEIGLDTSLATISFESFDPDVSALMANAYADALIASNLQAKVETSDRAQAYLLERLNEARVKLEDSERELLEYARTAGLTGSSITSPNGDGGTLPGQQIDQLSVSLAAATSRRIDAEQEWRQAQSTPATALSQVQANRAYQELQSQMAQLQGELAQERQLRTDEHPVVVAQINQIRQLEREIGAVAGNIKRSIEQRYRAAARQEAQLIATIDQLRDNGIAEQERGIGYKSIERELQTDRANYDGLLQRYKAVSEAAGAPSANVLMVDRAEPPLKPSSAGPVWILAIASIAGLIVGMGIALVSEASQSSIRTIDDLENALDLSVLGVVPKPRRGADMTEQLRNPNSPQSEAFKSVAASIEHSDKGPKPKSILITSALANEGKSTSAWGLARAFAALGKRVIVVNGDLRHPTPGPGFADALAGDSDAHALLLVEKKSKVGMIDTGTPRGELVRLLAPEKVKPVIDQLTQMADIVIVDGPPVMGLADAVLLADSVDAALVVVEACRTTAKEVDMALSRLPDRLPAGAILTKFDARRAGVSYGSTSYYSYGSEGWDSQPA